MITKVFSFLDTKTGIFNSPFFFPHVGMAMRAAADIGMDPQTTIGRHPSDFCLVELGTYDDQTGRFENTGPTNLGTVIGFLPQQPTLFGGNEESR